MNLSVLIPCYRSVATLPLLIPNLTNSLNRLVESGQVDDVQVILVIDGSPDETAVIARDCSDTSEKVTVVELQRNFGQHNALVAGIRLATGDIIVTMDDDLQHPPDAIGKLIMPILEDKADLVYAVPVVEEHGFLRSFASRTVKRGLSLAGVSNAEIIGAFRAFRTNLRMGFVDVNEPNVNLDVLLSWTTTRVVSVKVDMAQREDGQSGYGLFRLIKHTLNMVTGYGVAPLKFATLFGFLIGILGFGILVAEVIKYFLGQNNVAGFTTTIALVSVFAGAQLITIGIIGEYLGRMYFRTMKKPMFLIRESD